MNFIANFNVKKFLLGREKNEKKPEVINTPEDDLENVVKIKTQRGKIIIIHPNQEGSGFYDLQEQLLSIKSVEDFYSTFQFLFLNLRLVFTQDHISNLGTIFSTENKNREKDGVGMLASRTIIDEKLGIGKFNNDNTSEQLGCIARYTIALNFIKRHIPQPLREQLVNQINLDLDRIFSGKYHVDAIRTSNKKTLSFFSSGAIRRRSSSLQD